MQSTQDVLWLVALTLRLWELEGNGGTRVGLVTSEECPASTEGVILSQMTALCRAWGEVPAWSGDRVPQLEDRAQMVVSLLQATQAGGSRLALTNCQEINQRPIQQLSPLTPGKRAENIISKVKLTSGRKFQD